MLNKILALMTIMFWLLIPAFWIPVHYANNFFKRLGLISYILPIFTWLPFAIFIFLKRDFFYLYSLKLPTLFQIIGFFLLFVGISMHIWTIKLLGLLTIIGVPEITPAIKGPLVNKRLFSLVRHPTYLAHSLIFVGVFLITGFVSILSVAIIDFVIVNVFIIPAEEKELLERYGIEYIRYKKEVPYRFLPFIF